MDDVSPRLNGHTPAGKFAPGNTLARGNPNAKRMYELRRTLLEAVDPDKLRAAFGRLQDLAVAGDLDALPLYLSYAVGKPVQGVEVSAPEGEALPPAFLAAMNKVWGDAD